MSESSKHSAEAEEDSFHSLNATESLTDVSAMDMSVNSSPGTPAPGTRPAKEIHTVIVLLVVSFGLVEVFSSRQTCFILFFVCILLFV